MISEKKRLIVFIANFLSGRGITCHCDIFRRIQGMKPSTAERRLREIRAEYCQDPENLFNDFGYKAGQDHMWNFSRGFKHYLQLEARKIIEAQNDEDFKKHQEGK